MLLDELQEHIAERYFSNYINPSLLAAIYAATGRKMAPPVSKSDSLTLDERYHDGDDDGEKAASNGSHHDRRQPPQQNGKFGRNRMVAEEIDDTLDFGTIDPNSAVNAVATQTFAMKCSNGTTSTATTDDNGLNFASATKNMKHSVTATALLPYALAYTNDTGFVGAGFSNAAASRVITITGTITPAQFSGALATTGAQVYADTVVISVNP